MSSVECKNAGVTNRVVVAAAVLCLILLALLISFSPSKLCYDEPYHLALAESVAKSGLTAALTSPDNQSAAGALFPAIHSFLSPVTNIRTPGVRWVNFLCLILIITLLGLTLNQRGERPSWIWPFVILSVPFLWPAAGLALTEIPALLAFSGFIFCISRILTTADESSLPSSYAWSVLAGLALGFSILGRQTYLITLPAFASLFLTVPRKWTFWAVCLITAGLTCGWLFVIWGGLLPPSQSVVGEGIRIDHGILSLSYIAAATLFLRPDWMKPRNTLSILLITALAVLAAWLSRDYSSPPAKSLLLRFFDEPLALGIGFAIGTFLTAAGLLWGWNAVQDLWRDRSDPWRTFLLLTLLALVAAPAKVAHLFSSRYVVGALGVLVLVTFTPRATGWLATRIVAGSALGGALLWTYYQS